MSNNAIVLYDNKIESITAAWCACLYFTQQNKTVKHACVKKVTDWRIAGYADVIIAIADAANYREYLQQHCTTLHIFPPHAYIAVNTWRKFFRADVPEFVRIINTHVVENKGRYSTPLIVGMVNYANIDFKTFDMLYAKPTLYIPRLNKAGKQIIRVMDSVIDEIISNAQLITFMSRPTYMVQSLTLQSELGLYLSNYKTAQYGIIWWYEMTANVYKLRIHKRIDSGGNLIQIVRNCKDVLSIDDKLYADEEALILSVDASKISIAAFIEKNKYMDVDAASTLNLHTSPDLQPLNLHTSLDLSQSPISIHNQLHTSLSDLSVDDLFGELTLNDVSSHASSPHTSSHASSPHISPHTPPNIYAPRSL